MLLKHHAAAAPVLAQAAQVQQRPGQVRDSELALRGLHQAIQAAQQGGLAGARGAKQHHKTAGGQVQPGGLQRGVAVGVSDRHVTQRQQGWSEGRVHEAQLGEEALSLGGRRVTLMKLSP